LSALKSSYNDILVSTHPNLHKETGLSVGLIELNKPASLNALSDALFDDLIHALKAFDSMDNVGSIVLTGKGKAFAAGADIPEMSAKDFVHAYNSNMFSQWADVCKISKPIIAAVNGYALGGGCELAMMCDIVIASSNARFGQPEVNLGIIPGAGGTQRLIRCIGKSKAMEMVLTGEMIDAQKAERDGMISKVVEKREDLLAEAIRHVVPTCLMYFFTYSSILSLISCLTTLLFLFLLRFDTELGMSLEKRHQLQLGWQKNVSWLQMK
jgi:enoyl-CoA hydratase/carnithine racemase